MKRSLIVAIALGCGLLVSTSIARKTYTFEEIEAMKKAGKFTGAERFVVITGTEATFLIPDKTEAPSLTPSSRQEKDAPVERKRNAASTGTIAYDKIGLTRYLTTMSREYYGNPDFWPYIYEENKERFGHPDKITPGTTVIIPSLTKYGVNPKNPSDIEKAKRMGREIYARYGKSI